MPRLPCCLCGWTRATLAHVLTRTGRCPRHEHRASAAHSRSISSSEFHPVTFTKSHKFELTHIHSRFKRLETETRCINKLLAIPSLAHRKPQLTTHAGTMDSTFETRQQSDQALELIPYTCSFSLYRFPPHSSHLPAALLATSLADQLSPDKSSASSSSTTHTANSASSMDTSESLKKAGHGFLTVSKTVEEVSIMVEVSSSGGTTGEATTADSKHADLVRALDRAVDQAHMDGVDAGNTVKDGPFRCIRVRGPMKLGRSSFLLSVAAWAGKRVWSMPRPVDGFIISFDS